MYRTSIRTMKHQRSDSYQESRHLKFDERHHYRYGDRLTKDILQRNITKEEIDTFLNEGE